jgi:hypothetical protein
MLKGDINRMKIWETPTMNQLEVEQTSGGIDPDFYESFDTQSVS